MSNKVLIVVDMQNDFIYGALGSEEARKIVPNVVKKVNEYKNRNDLIVVTQDTHYSKYLDTQEGKKLPIPHCIANTNGWQIEDDTYQAIRGYKNLMYFNKSTFGSVAVFEKLKQYIPNDQQDEWEIEFVGLVLNICVISNVMLAKAYFPNANISVDLSCTAATSAHDFGCACTILNSCQVDVHE